MNVYRTIATMAVVSVLSVLAAPAAAQTDEDTAVGLGLFSTTTSSAS